MLVTRARIRPGEDVLVLAAGSGVGQAAIQIASLHGARVFATAGNEEKLARAREVGAHEVVNHHSQDIAAEIRRFTNNRGVDIVIEHVGEATWERSLKCLARGGRLVTCGATTGHKAAIDLRFLFSKQYTLMGSYMGTKGELLRAAAFFFSGQLRPVVDRTFPLADAGAVWESGVGSLGACQFPVISYQFKEDCDGLCVEGPFERVTDNWKPATRRLQSPAAPTGISTALGVLRRSRWPAT
jgi:NADPH:quinone reductase-like Zn-dependent oxidoreductase